MNRAIFITAKFHGVPPGLLSSGMTEMVDFPARPRPCLVWKRKGNTKKCGFKGRQTRGKKSFLWG